MDDYNKYNDEIENMEENNYEGVNDKQFENESYYEGENKERENARSYYEKENKEQDYYEDDSTKKDLEDSSFYTETYSKPKKKKNAVLAQLIIVAMISSLLGGVVSSVVYSQLSNQELQPSAESLFEDNDMTAQNTVNSGESEGSDYYRKVVVESADSPVVAIAEKVGSSVVGISVTGQSVQRDFWFFGPDSGETSSQGSGIIIRSDGYIMTNNHVIEAALEGTSNEIGENAKIEVILPNDKDTAYPAELVGRDRRTDLAVLKIEKDNLPAVEFGDSDEVRVGELAVAIGNPGGLEYMGSVTVGVISGLNRTIPITDDRDMKLIQTDASINPGNSGGALVNASGQLIGVNTVKIGGFEYEGLGFAIPVNRVKEITDHLIEYNYVRGRPLIGIIVETRFTEEIAESNNMPMGVLVEEVSLYSAAHGAGVRRMDIITKFDGVRVKSLEELNDERDNYEPGDIVTIEVFRDGETIELELEMGEEGGQ
ncbi:trypsin-like peptidase domain-containing protein [Herbivorax sp. ANBcel31]|uniref:S1C family serine protease n=1 Tax=Herbivorax sp. ANBcel31 TaxID=3069754 RepID=UPI0027B6C2A3|nr:trypsin-like peptidase domain-containing protein [Herbivorax sp. ANBcel31]MDQ2085022.1 trypsin-like peptidase domain-containing protein [Herbivorax sp. ANBcel31]